MKIVVFGRFGPDNLGSHVVETLQQMGHETVECDPLNDILLPWTASWSRPQILGKVRGIFVREMLGRPSFAKALVRKVNSQLGGSKCDLMISLHDFLSPDAMSQLKHEFKSPLALWFPDAVSRLGKSFMLSGLYDFLFFKDPFLVTRLREELGLASTFYLPECCNPSRHSPPPNSTFGTRYDVGTVGNLHPARVTVLKKLAAQGVSTAVWGPSFPRWTEAHVDGIESLPVVANAEKIAAFRSCRIVVNTVHPTEVESSNVRTFEVAASGAFQLTTTRPSLGSLFDIGSELETYSSIDELASKVRYFLEQPELRSKIAAAAQRRVLADHTFEKRLEELLGIVEMGSHVDTELIRPAA